MMSNNSNKNQSEFLEAVRTINLLNSLVDENNEIKHLFITKITNHENINSCNCTFKILSKERVWLKSYTYEEFTSHKAKMGFDGNWKVFFKTLEQAISKVEGGDIKLKLVKKSKEAKDCLIITFIHPIAEDLKMKSEISFEKFYNSNSDEFRNINYDIMLELYESKQHIQIQKEKEQVKIPSNQVTSNLVSAKLEVKKNMKRKYNADLINPNAKKRKNKGAKFIQEENKDSQDSDSEL
jgi:hypothetical protein